MSKRKKCFNVELEPENPVAINRYKIKAGTTEDDVRNFSFQDGGTWIHQQSRLFRTFHLTGEIELNIGFDNVENWDDFNYVLILDDDFGQPYTPFYGDNYGKQISNFEFLQKVIRLYNDKMDSVPFLERIEEVHDEKDLPGAH